MTAAYTNTTHGYKHLEESAVALRSKTNGKNARVRNPESNAADSGTETSGALATRSVVLHLVCAAKQLLVIHVPMAEAYIRAGESLQ